MDEGRDLAGEITQLISDPKATRDNVADLYMEAIISDFDKFPWADVNHAIMARWSYNALRYIKRQAWQR